MPLGGILWGVGELEAVGILSFRPSLYFVSKFKRKMPNPAVNTSIEHRAFHFDRKNPFGVATLFGELFITCTGS